MGWGERLPSEALAKDWSPRAVRVTPILLAETRSTDNAPAIATAH